MICNVCGNILPDNATRCNVCGNIMNPNAPAQGGPGMPYQMGGQQGALAQGGPGMPYQTGGQQGAPAQGGPGMPYQMGDQQGTPAQGGSGMPYQMGGQQDVPTQRGPGMPYQTGGQQDAPTQRGPGMPYQTGGQQDVPTQRGSEMTYKQPGPPRPVNGPVGGGQPNIQGVTPENMPPQKGDKKPGSKTGFMIAMSIVMFLLVCGIGVCVYFLTKNGKGTDGSGTQVASSESSTDASTTQSADVATTEKSGDDLSGGGTKYEALNVSSITDSSFPLVELTLSGHGDVDAKKTTIKEDGEDVEIKDIRDDNGKKVITYVANNISAGGKARNIQVTVDGKEIKAGKGAQLTYNEPQLQTANVTIESCDASNYPEVTLYVTVANADSVIQGLSSENFYIKEKISNGKYIYKEVTESEMLDKNAALNISLIADKSSSISYDDMDKIKSVLNDFVGNLQYDAGDRAELLAIDDISRQMCTFTNDSQFLKNGISSMFPEGMTDLYEGMYQGVQHVIYQDGAKCVIAFTDGYNTVDSGYSAQSVIDIANMYEVPVYVIGVGYDEGYDTTELQTIAESTGGRYWNIDDLYDLNEIYQTIYTQQKQMYKIVYNCDESVKQSSERDLVVSMVDDTYCANDQEKVTPVTVDKSGINKTHSSRYELVLADLSWEDANVAANMAGGHLVTITSKEEEDTIISMAEAQGVDYVWLGGYTAYDRGGDVFGHWVTGEDFSSYQHWCKDEPSRTDKDGEPEWYVMLWNVPSLGGWTWNDQRNDPASVPGLEYFKGKMAYVIEYED